MKRRKSWKSLYEGLKRNEIELLKWYHDNPLSVYIEIALMILADIGIIMEEQREGYKAKVEGSAGRLRAYLRRRGNGSAMDKDALKGFLFDVMKEYDELFEDISLDDGTNTLFVTAVDEERFIVTVNPVTADEALIEL